MRIEQKINNILLIRRRAMGDALVTLPAIAEVRVAWPSARIDLVMDRPFAPLLTGLAPEVNVLTYPPAVGSSWIRLLREAGYDLVIDWLSTPRTALWSVLTGAPVRVGYDLRLRWWAYNVRVPRNCRGGEHFRSFAGESFLDPLRSLGLVPAPWRGGKCADRDLLFPEGSIRPEILRWTSDWIHRSAPRVILVMSATWSAKAWPAQLIRQLFALMSTAGICPMLVTGPGDEVLAAQLEPDLAPEFWAPPTNLPELVHILQGADLFVGTDCGVRHLAASLGVPTVTLFGPTDAVGWNPATPDHVAVRVGKDCSPCDLTICPVPGHPCMSELSPVLVLEAVNKILARLKREKKL